MSNVSFFILVLGKWHRTLNWELIWVVRFGCLPVSLGKQANYLYFSVREVIWYLGLASWSKDFYFLLTHTGEVKEKNTWQGILQNNIFFVWKLIKNMQSIVLWGKVAHGEFHERERQEVHVPTTKICNGFSVVLGGKNPTLIWEWKFNQSQYYFHPKRNLVYKHFSDYGTQFYNSSFECTYFGT